MGCATLKVMPCGNPVFSKKNSTARELKNNCRKKEGVTGYTGEKNFRIRIVQRGEIYFVSESIVTSDAEILPPVRVVRKGDHAIL
jgi:hypothetical protein